MNKPKNPLTVPAPFDKVPIHTETTKLNTMRTKALFVAAATGLAALTTSMAQVYSVNVVGYINVDLVAGFNMIANQLDNGSGNVAWELLDGQVDDGTVIYKFNTTTGGYDILVYDVIWDGATDMTLAPGEGCFVQAPAAKTVTFVGEVLEGSQDVAIPAGFSMFSAVAPVATDLSAASVAWPAVDGDVFYAWDAGIQNYSITVFDIIWDPAPLTLAVGQSAWVNKGAAATWTRDFTVPRN